MRPVVILAGGLGTRLRSVVSDVPKSLAPVAGKPFLWWLLRMLQRQGVQEAHLCTGYKAGMIHDTFGSHFGEMRLYYSIEDEPLGTGGAVMNALRGIDAEEFFVLNGDTLACVQLQDLLTTSGQKPQADALLCGVEVADAQRYGTLQFDPELRVHAFLEKGRQGSGVINGGVYLLKRSVLAGFTLPKIFSIERDFFQSHMADLQLYVGAIASEFIDIGVPEDYVLAQTKVPLLLSEFG